jgi:hypothetical protein
MRAEEPALPPTWGEALVSRRSIVGEPLLGEAEALVQADFADESVRERSEIFASGRYEG